MVHYLQQLDLDEGTGRGAVLLFSKAGDVCGVAEMAALGLSFDDVIL